MMAESRVQTVGPSLRRSQAADGDGDDDDGGDHDDNDGDDYEVRSFSGLG